MSSSRNKKQQRPITDAELDAFLKSLENLSSEATGSAHAEINAVEESVPDWSSSSNLQIAIPLASKVVRSQTPTPDYLLLVALTALKIIENIQANATTKSFLSRVIDIKSFQSKIERLSKANAATIASGRRNRALWRPSTVGERPVERPKDIWWWQVPPLQIIENSVRSISTSLVALADSLFNPDGERTETPTDDELKDRKPITIEEYNEIFATIPPPRLADGFQDDVSFAMQRLMGNNPMIIKGVSKAELDSLVGSRIDDATFNAVLGTSEDTVEQAGIDGRLLVADYESLSGIPPLGRLGKMQVVNPIAVFAEPVSGSDLIMPVAIQLGQNPTDSELLFPNTDDKHRWMIAKSVVQAADAVHMQFVEHVPRIHFVTDPISIATQRNLCKDHALYKLLMPHFEGSNFINFVASTTFGVNGIIDEIYCQTDARLKAIRRLSISSRLSFDFTNRMPDVELESRGMNKIKEYPYRDDIMLLWKHLLEWVGDYVDLYYFSDKDVLNDTAVRRWAKDIAGEGRMHNFHVPKSKNELVRTVAMIIHVASGQHAVLNFGQFDGTGYCPNVPGMTWDDIPTDAPATEDNWLMMLPPLKIAESQLSLTYAFSSVKYTSLGEYRSNVFPYWGTLDLRAEIAWRKFTANLEEMEKEITSRNEARGRFAFYYLLPSRIPASVNI